MGECFKQWRRKLGVVTLGLACVFMGGWLRNMRTNDQVIIAIGEPCHVFASQDGYLRWTSYKELNTTAAPVLWQSSSVGEMSGIGEPLDNAAIKWRWRWLWCGFDCGRGLIHGIFPVGVWAVPYWIDIPLTGLSAYLLILTPRKSTLKKIAKPIPTEGT